MPSIFFMKKESAAIIIYFFQMYDFEGDYETVFTGETNSQLSGLIDTYNGVTDLPHWNGKHCSNLQNASDGTKFKGGVSGNESLSFYRKSLCRTATMVCFNNILNT